MAIATPQEFINFMFAGGATRPGLTATVAEKGSPNAIPDAGVASAAATAAATAAAARRGLAAVEGALLNVALNLGGLADEEYKNNIQLAAEPLRQQARAAKEAAMAAVEGKL